MFHSLKKKFLHKEETAVLSQVQDSFLEYETLFNTYHESLKLLLFNQNKNLFEQVKTLQRQSTMMNSLHDIFQVHSKHPYHGIIESGILKYAETTSHCDELEQFVNNYDKTTKETRGIKLFGSKTNNQDDFSISSEPLPIPPKTTPPTVSFSTLWFHHTRLVNKLKVLLKAAADIAADIQKRTELKSELSYYVTKYTNIAQEYHQLCLRYGVPAPKADSNEPPSHSNKKLSNLWTSLQQNGEKMNIAKDNLKQQEANTIQILYELLSTRHNKLATVFDLILVYQNESNCLNMFSCQDPILKLKSLQSHQGQENNGNLTNNDSKPTPICAITFPVYLKNDQFVTDGSGTNCYGVSAEPKSSHKNPKRGDRNWLNEIPSDISSEDSDNSDDGIFDSKSNPKNQTINNKNYIDSSLIKLNHSSLVDLIGDSEELAHALAEHYAIDVDNGSPSTRPLIQLNNLNNKNQKTHENSSKQRSLVDIIASGELEQMNDPKYVSQLNRRNSLANNGDKKKGINSKNNDNEGECDDNNDSDNNCDNYVNDNDDEDDFRLLPHQKILKQMQDDLKQSQKITKKSQKNENVTDVIEYRQIDPNLFRSSEDDFGDCEENFKTPAHSLNTSSYHHFNRSKVTTPKPPIFGDKQKRRQSSSSVSGNGQISEKRSSRHCSSTSSTSQIGRHDRDEDRKERRERKEKKGNDRDGKDDRTRHKKSARGHKKSRALDNIQEVDDNTEDFDDHIHKNDQNVILLHNYNPLYNKNNNNIHNNNIHNNNIHNNNNNIPIIVTNASDMQNLPYNTQYESQLIETEQYNPAPLLIGKVEIQLVSTQSGLTDVDKGNEQIQQFHPNINSLTPITDDIDDIDQTLLPQSQINQSQIDYTKQPLSVHLSKRVSPSDQSDHGVINPDSSSSQPSSISSLPNQTQRRRRNSCYDFSNDQDEATQSAQENEKKMNLLRKKQEERDKAKREKEKQEKEKKVAQLSDPKGPKLNANQKKSNSIKSPQIVSRQNSTLTDTKPITSGSSSQKKPKEHRTVITPGSNTSYFSTSSSPSSSKKTGFLSNFTPSSESNLMSAKTTEKGHGTSMAQTKSKFGRRNGNYRDNDSDSDEEDNDDWSSSSSDDDDDDDGDDDDDKQHISLFQKKR